MGCSIVSSVCGCEEVRVDVTRDLAAEVGGLDVGSPEVDPGPDARFEDLVGQVEKRVKARCSPGNRLLVA